MVRSNATTCAKERKRKTSLQQRRKSVDYVLRRLVSWCFKPSLPQKITSGLMETFIKKYMAERTNKTEITPKEQSEKAESCRENLWNETQLKGP